MPTRQDWTMRELVDYLNETARAYYVLDNPVISDGEWDQLYSLLQKMEKESGVILPDSPSLRVGGEPLAAFRQHRHLSRLWSMDKAQSPEELQAWFDRTEKLRAQEPSLPPLTYGVEYKFDGLTLNLTYDHGVLIEAATRGNGEVGEAILPQARTVRGVPLSIPWQGLIEVQGEGFISLMGSRQFRTICDGLCADAGFAPNIIFESDNPATVKNMIAAGMGVGFWPEFTWGELDSDGVRLIEIVEPVCVREIQFHYRKNKLDHSTVEDFFEFLTSFCLGKMPQA